MAIDIRDWARRIVSLAQAGGTKGKPVWDALPERGWPAAGAMAFLKEPPRWFVVFFSNFVFIVVARAIYLMAFGTAEEVNKFMVGVAAFAGAPFLVWRTWIADRQRHVAQEELYTSLLTKAVEQLGATREEKTYEIPQIEDDLFGGRLSGPPLKKESVVRTVPNVEVRLGAIYALEKLAKDYLPLHWQIMEILCAYVRENAKLSGDPHEDAPPPYPIIIQTALTVIGTRSSLQRTFEAHVREEANRGRFAITLDLRNCNLVGLNLQYFHMEEANFFHSNLARASLRGAHLEASAMNGVNLADAVLSGAHLQKASLEGARLDRARLEARLHGAWLFAATGLTQAQLDRAHGDETTTIPVGLTRPAHWTRGAAGEGEGE